MSCVENDAKMGARCHNLKIDIRNLKCTKIDAKKEKGKGVREEETIRIFAPKFPFHADEKNFYSTRNSNFTSRHTDRVEIPRIPTK